jgi:hypothetical protein
MEETRSTRNRRDKLERENYFIEHIEYICFILTYYLDRYGRNRMVVGFMTNYEIGAYHH